MTATPPRTAAEFAAAWDLPMRTIRSAPGALEPLPDVVAELLPAAELGLLHDGTPKAVGASDLLIAVRDRLARRSVRTVTATAGTPGVVLDETTVRAAVDGSRGVTGPISVGSGTVSDLGKAVAAELDLPLVAVQTAASVNGYADPLSVLVPPADPEERVLSSWVGLDPTGRVDVECWGSVRRKFDTWAANGAAVRAFFDDWPRHEPILRRLAHPPEKPSTALANWSATSTFSALTPAVAAEPAR